MEANLSKRMKIIAHRGGPARAPENTLLSFKRALDDGADGFECDVVLTRDGEPVILHVPFYSQSISKLVGKKANVGNLDWIDMRGLRVDGEPIPHLHDVLSFIKAHSVECFFEPKQNSNNLVERVVRGIEEYEVVDKAHLITFYLRKNLLVHSKELNPMLKTSVILLTPCSRLTSRARAASADEVVPGWKGINQIELLALCIDDLVKKVKETREQGIGVYSGIADDRKSARWLCELGVDGIFTNNVPLVKRTIELY